MVKFSNKARGKPTKRRTLKSKFKIERKVKQYKKKVKKEAKKMKEKGIHHKKNPEKDVLPNMFPLKQQMLQQFKESLPKEPQAPINILKAAEYGLVTMENKPLYFPKGRQNYTKKYITNHSAVFNHSDFILYVADSRNGQISIDEAYLQEAKKAKASILFVLMKCDTVSEKRLKDEQEKLTARGFKWVKFSNESKHKGEMISELLKQINAIKLAKGQDETNNTSLVVVGKANTGKHTLIQILCRYAGKYQDLPSELFELNMASGLKIIDAPVKIEDKTGFPLFHVPSEIGHEESVAAQEESLLKLLFFGGQSGYKGSILNRNQILEYYLIQDYTSIDDLCKKIGKSLKVFGKGGMIDVGKVRVKVLTEWFTGKLNRFMNPMK